jgi:hypothetical protein
VFVDSVGTGMSARASRALMARGSGCLAWYGVDEMRMLCQLLRRSGIDIKTFHLPFLMPESRHLVSPMLHRCMCQNHVLSMYRCAARHHIQVNFQGGVRQVQGDSRVLTGQSD